MMQNNTYKMQAKEEKKTKKRNYYCLFGVNVV